MRAKVALAAVGIVFGVYCVLASSEFALGQAPATPSATQKTTPPAAQKATPPAEQKSMYQAQETEKTTPSESREYTKKEVMETMEKTEVPPEAVMGCCMMMCMEVKADDPAAVLALKEELKLTPAQLEQLKKIAEQAREDAGKVLTAEQKKVLEPLAKKSCSMMKMHHDLMHKLGFKMKERKEGAVVVCPLMKMVEAMEHKHGAEEEAEEEEAEHAEKEKK